MDWKNQERHSANRYSAKRCGERYTPRSSPIRHAIRASEGALGPWHKRECVPSSRMGWLRQKQSHHDIDEPHGKIAFLSAFAGGSVTFGGRVRRAFQPDSGKVRLENDKGMSAEFRRPGNQSPVDRVQRCQRYPKIAGPLRVQSLVTFCDLCARARYIAKIRENRASSENCEIPLGVRY